ncbi:hypothetical protein A1O3_00614 [Capronia epimyces CBS 606.96]|uniref:Uncharacterized protein n=1 Tax=Capronia epimyces CBS 606.96 TaxID=1182542 RepID=W9ZC26_9EURO|nr:uncharacterized protein A1O3_00614 [Capronia epimyces CBS 606.96]EXJ92064.1 hypothetical protein A1O3_00614 [Capronia epimyces CBS 606.96]
MSGALARGEPRPIAPFVAGENGSNHTAAGVVLDSQRESTTAVGGELQGAELDSLQHSGLPQLSLTTASVSESLPFACDDPSLSLSPRGYVDQLAASHISATSGDFMDMTDPSTGLNLGRAVGSGMDSPALETELELDLSMPQESFPHLAQHGTMTQPLVLDGTCFIDTALQQEQGIADTSWTWSLPCFPPGEIPPSHAQLQRQLHLQGETLTSRTSLASDTKDLLGGLMEVLQDRGMEEVISAGFSSMFKSAKRQTQRHRQETARTLFSGLDPYLSSSMQPPGTTIFSGLIYNAYCLGFSLRDLFLVPKHPSPLYKPDQAHVDPQSLVAAAGTNPSMPANLRPTLPQVIYPHSTFLDLLPFPEMRSRAITLAATVPHIFDWFDLKWDLEYGLIYHRVRTSSSGDPGQPWDPRNWKATPWFLQKWHILMDDKTREMLKQTTVRQRTRRDVWGI